MYCGRKTTHHKNIGLIYVEQTIKGRMCLVIKNIVKETYQINKL
jgi:hypothetical protein